LLKPFQVSLLVGSFRCHFREQMQLVTANQVATPPMNATKKVAATPMKAKIEVAAASSMKAKKKIAATPMKAKSQVAAASPMRTKKKVAAASTDCYSEDTMEYRFGKAWNINPAIAMVLQLPCHWQAGAAKAQTCGCGHT
jgi:hypothetical protein